MRSRLLVDQDLADEVLRVFESWGARWRKYNREQEDRMNHRTVSWLPELERTPNNEALVQQAFEQQIPEGELVVPFAEGVVEGDRVTYDVWGFYSRSCVMLFVSPR